MDKITISILILTSFTTLGQGKKEAKREKIITTIVGTWVFKDGDIKDNQIGDIKVNEWHTDTIFFYSDMTIKFYSRDSMNDNIRKNSGLWDISENGKNLILKDRQVTPPFDEPITDLQLPIKINSNQLTIKYSITLKPDESTINKSALPTTGQKSAEINYVRLK